MNLLRNTLSVHETARPLRRLLLVGVFLLCALAFWMHFERRFADIEARVALMDETGLLSEADRTVILERRTLFRKLLGVNVLAHVRNTTVLLPELSGNTLFVGLTPTGNQTAVALPTLVRRALPPNFNRQLENRLQMCAATPGPCLVAALDELLTVLGTEGALPPQTPPVGGMMPPTPPQ